MLKKFKEIKPLIIGIGIQGKRHLEAQLNLGFKTGIYSTNPKIKQSFEKNNNVIIFDNLADGIDWSNLVHVCTPDDKHTEFVAEALKKGKTVLCEKSLTTNLEDALKLQQLAHKHNGLLIVGQNYRLTPTFAEIRERILAGQIGIITKIETTYFHDESNYQQRYGNKNFLYTGGAHAVDLASWISGEKISTAEVISSGNLYYQIAVQFSSGLIGEIKLDASLSRDISGTDLIVYGEQGKLVGHNKLDELLAYKNKNRKPQVIKFPNTSTFTVALEIKIIDDYLLGRRNFYWPLPDVDEAVNTIKILDAVEKSF